VIGQNGDHLELRNEQSFTPKAWWKFILVFKLNKRLPDCKIAVRTIVENDVLWFK
jgi:L,D-peptidoglycan transpeptidase YkuD (ErfK/YbiS/YcfS/YnhG family)